MVCTPQCVQDTILNFSLSVFPRLICVDIFGNVQFLKWPEAALGDQNEGSGLLHCLLHRILSKF